VWRTTIHAWNRLISRLDIVATCCQEAGIVERKEMRANLVTDAVRSLPFVAR
jgi:hypothetical protein